MSRGSASPSNRASISNCLNRQLKPNGLMFGPDPASSNRATVGGVVGNNSTGAHSILYGMTGDNVVSVRVALAQGGVAELESGRRRNARRAGGSGRSARASVDAACSPFASESRPDRPRLSAPLASRNRLFARPVAQAGRRVQSGSFSSRPRARWRPRCRSRSSCADAEQDGVGPAPVRRAGRGNGSDHATSWKPIRPPSN